MYMLQSEIAIADDVQRRLSVDQLVQLWEICAHRLISYHPPMISPLLGSMDRVVPGTALFVLPNPD